MENTKTKFEFVGETTIFLNQSGLEETKTVYFTKRNDMFVSDSLSYDKETAQKLFELVVKHNGELRKTTVLKTEMV